MKKGSPKKEKKLSHAELLATAQRIQADYENFRKRTQIEKEEFAKYANTNLIMQILPILDNFRLATRHKPKEFEGDSWAQGIEHIEKQLEQVLASEGLTEIESLGKKFDPHIHEAIEEVESKDPPGTITEEVLKGYKLNERIIRHAKVKVSKGEKNE